MLKTAPLAAICVSLIGLLLFGLGAAITLQRRRTQTYFGFNNDPSDALYRLIRAHGNTAEYGGVLCLLIWSAGQVPMSIWSMCLVVVVTLSRYCQALGMLLGPTLNSPPNMLRLVGTTGTYTGGAALCLSLVSALF
jgi:uncharacterized membrane protein YecN with MAPEG domain